MMYCWVRPDVNTPSITRAITKMVKPINTSRMCFYGLRPSWALVPVSPSSSVNLAPFQTPTTIGCGVILPWSKCSKDKNTLWIWRKKCFGRGGHVNISIFVYLRCRNNYNKTKKQEQRQREQQQQQQQQQSTHTLTCLGGDCNVYLTSGFLSNKRQITFHKVWKHAHIKPISLQDALATNCIRCW